MALASILRLAITAGLLQTPYVNASCDPAHQEEPKLVQSTGQDSLTPALLRKPSRLIQDRMNMFENKSIPEEPDSSGGQKAEIPGSSTLVDSPLLNMLADHALAQLDADLLECSSVNSSLSLSKDSEN